MKRYRGTSVVGKVLLSGIAICALGGSLLTAPSASAARWANCGGDWNKAFSRVESKGLPCSSAWILGEEVLDAWDGFKPRVKVRGFTCTMSSGYPFHAAVSGNCKKGKKRVKFATWD